MRTFIRFSLIVPLCLAWVGCGPKAPPQRVHPDVLTQAGLRYYWSLNVDLDEDESILRISHLGENVYVLTSNYRLVAVDAARGLTKWSYQVAGPGQTVFDPTHVDGLKVTSQPIGIAGILSPDTLGEIVPFDAVLINTLNYVLVLDRNTGQMYRRIPFDFAANTTGISDGKYFYVGSTEGLLYGVLLNESVKGWTLSATDMITARVLYHDGRIFMADESGGVFAVSTGMRGTKVWTQKLNGSVTADFFVDARGCFVPCDDQRLYAFSRQTGERLWDRPFVCQRPLRDAVQVSEKSVFQFAAPEMFYAIDVAAGTQRWARPDGRLVLGVLGGEIYLLNADNTLMIMDELSGAVRTSLPMAGWDLFVPNTSGPEVFVASRDGQVACIREQAAGRLTTEKLRMSPAGQAETAPAMPTAPIAAPAAPAAAPAELPQ